MNPYAYNSGKKNKFANRGVSAENMVHEFLKAWTDGRTGREANRLVDSKAAGRTIKAAAADFDYFCPRAHGLIEVKETQHDFRIERRRITQLPRLRKRENAGGKCFALVNHTGVRLWRCMTVPFMTADDTIKGSWDLSGLPAFATLTELFEHYAPGVFD